MIAPARICSLLKLFNRILLPTLLLAGLLLTGCAGRAKKIKLPPPVKGKIGWTERGVASWYGHPYHGRITSNGEVYDMNKMTAAHKRLPFNTWVRVTNLDNKQITIVRINDRGPFVGKRIIDLSRAAATDINMIVSGTALVQLKVIRPQKGKNPPSSRKSSTGQQPQPNHNPSRTSIFRSVCFQIAIMPGKLSTRLLTWGLMQPYWNIRSQARDATGSWLLAVADNRQTQNCNA